MYDGAWRRHRCPECKGCGRLTTQQRVMYYVGRVVVWVLAIEFTVRALDGIRGWI